MEKGRFTYTPHPDTRTLVHKHTHSPFGPPHDPPSQDGCPHTSEEPCTVPQAGHFPKGSFQVTGEEGYGDALLKNGKEQTGCQSPCDSGYSPINRMAQPRTRALFKKKKNCFSPNLFNYHLFSVPLTPSPLVVLESNVGGSWSTYPIPAPSLER